MKRYGKLLMGGLLAMGLFASLFGCGKNATAEIEVWTEFTYTMEYVPPEEREERAEPVHETYTVKKGDKVHRNLLSVKDVTEDAVVLELDIEYVGAVYGPDGMARKRYTDPGTVFTVRKGEHLSLTEYGLMDADFSVDVIVK